MFDAVVRALVILSTLCLIPTGARKGRTMRLLAVAALIPALWSSPALGLTYDAIFVGGATLTASNGVVFSDFVDLDGLPSLESTTDWRSTETGFAFDNSVFFGPSAMVFSYTATASGVDLVTGIEATAFGEGQGGYVFGEPGGGKISLSTDLTYGATHNFAAGFVEAMPTDPPTDPCSDPCSVTPIQQLSVTVSQLLNSSTFTAEHQLGFDGPGCCLDPLFTGFEVRTIIPEPSTALLMVLGLVGLGAVGRRK